MDRAFVLLFMIVVGIILWFILHATGVFQSINHDIALWIGFIASYVSGMLGWKIVKVYRAKANRLSQD